MMPPSTIDVLPVKNAREKCWYCKRTFKSAKKIKYSARTYHSVCLYEILNEDSEIEAYLDEEELIEKIKTKLKEKPQDQDSFQAFVRLVKKISLLSDNSMKTQLCRNYLYRDNVLRDDALRRVNFLLPKDVYNLKDKQLLNIFSKLFGFENEITPLPTETLIVDHFGKNPNYRPAVKSTLTLIEVDEFLQSLKPESQQKLAKCKCAGDKLPIFKKILPKCTEDDLEIIILLIKKNLKIKASFKPILQAIHPKAYDAYLHQSDVRIIIEKVKAGILDQDIEPFTPISPMLATACDNIAKFFSKFENGVCIEKKYDGERIQVHKVGQQFEFYSRSLKNTVATKTVSLRDALTQAFPNAETMILDGEILMHDTLTNQPLPFGTLGVHKQELLENATLSIVVFDCLYYNGKSFISESMQVRRQHLVNEIVPIENKVLLSEGTFAFNANDAVEEVVKMLDCNWEGIMLKKTDGIYEPGKRHWLKIKKENLLQGYCLDTVDLTMLGACYGKGKNSHIFSSFLMGCYNSETEQYQAVTRVSFPLSTIDFTEECQEGLEVAESYPQWLKRTKNPLPMFIAKDPKKQPIWEISGTEFTNSLAYEGISIRSPRFQRIRHDKDFKTATTYKEFEKIAYSTNLDTGAIKRKLLHEEPSPKRVKKQF
jgi:DNA ligase-3